MVSKQYLIIISCVRKKPNYFMLMKLILSAMLILRLNLFEILVCVHFCVNKKAHVVGKWGRVCV